MSFSYVTVIAKLSFLTENSTHNIPEMKFGHVTLDHRRQKITVACIVPISSSEACLRKSFFSLQSRSQFSYSYSSVNLLIFSFGYLLTACLFNMSSKADREICRHSHYFRRNGLLPGLNTQQSRLVSTFGFQDGILLTG